MAVVWFLGFGVGARISFNISLNDRGRSLYLVLYYRHLIGLQNRKNIWEFSYPDIAQFWVKYGWEVRNTISPFFVPEPVCTGRISELLWTDIEVNLVSLLTLSQTTHFRPFQTERVCRRQFQIWWKWQKALQKGRKHCGERRNCSLRVISPLPTVFSKDLYCRHLKTRACLGKG